jgi:uncharacterized protein
MHGLEGSKADQHVLCGQLPSTPGRATACSCSIFVVMASPKGSGPLWATGRCGRCEGALSWLDEQSFEPGEMILHGWSMGRATVLRSAPGAGVAAVVEESGYADLPLLLRDRLSESSGLPSLFNPGIFLMAKLFLDLDPWAVRPEEDAAKLSEEGVPLLIIHSTGDEVVPFEHAEMLAASHPDAEFWKIEGYGHVEAYSHPEYRQKLLGFLERVEAGEAA